MSGDVNLQIIGSIDHLPAFSVNPPGVLVLTRHWDETSAWLTVKRADPQVEFSDELLREFAGGGDNDGMYPDVEIRENYEHNMSQCRSDGRFFNGWQVHIHGRDRTVIYRIGEYIPKRDSWRAAWPD